MPGDTNKEPSVADFNLFQGGRGPAISSDCGCGNLPAQYPCPQRVAVHYKAQVFTLSDQFNLRVNSNKRCVICDAAETVAKQTANLTNKKVGILRVPPRHKVEDIRIVADAGVNGAGFQFQPYIDKVDPTTGAVLSSVTLPPGIAGPFTLTSGTLVDVFAELTAGSRYTGADAWEIGFKMLAFPSPAANITTMCQFDGHVDFVAKVQGYDYGNE